MLNMKSKLFKYIYAMLCLLPAIAVGVTCVYAANNDNAYQSYYGQTINEVQYQQDNSLEVGKQYYLSFNNYTQLISSSQSFSLSNIDNLTCNDTSTLNNINNIINDINTIVFANNGTSNMYVSFRDNATSLLNVGVQNKLLSFTFVSDSNIELIEQTKDFIYSISYNDYSFMDNVFYYSLDKVENSNVFSWVKSNFLYSGVNQFVGIFGGTNSNISFYLTWVLTISLCYLGFEVLMLFINMARNLIHSFTDKDRW